MVFNLSCLYRRHQALRLQELLLPPDSAKPGVLKPPAAVKAPGFRPSSLPLTALDYNDELQN